MRKLLGYATFWLFVALVCLTIFMAFVQPVLFFALASLCLLTGSQVFKNTLNLVQGIGFVYWIVRDTHKGFSLSTGFMRETDFPWRTGRGIQIGIGKYVFQIGFCKRNKLNNEIIGLTHALKGRELNLKPTEIGEWR